MKAYFGDKSVFNKREEIEEHVQWLLPDKDEDVEDEESNSEEDEDDNGDDDDNDVDVEEIVRRRKKKFVGAPFLYENGLIGPANEPVCVLARSTTQLALSIFVGPR